MAVSTIVISQDLILISRIQQALSSYELSNSVKTLTKWNGEGADLLLVDLNGEVELRLVTVAAIRAKFSAVPLVGFCGHEDKQVRKDAMSAGATEVVINGALQTAALRWIDKLGLVKCNNWPGND